MKGFTDLHLNCFDMLAETRVFLGLSFNSREALYILSKSRKFTCEHGRVIPLYHLFSKKVEPLAIWPCDGLIDFFFFFFFFFFCDHENWVPLNKLGTFFLISRIKRRK